MAAPPLPLIKAARFRAEALAFDALAGLVRVLGPDRASALSGAIWRRLAPLNARHRRAQAQMRTAMPELSEAEIAAHLDTMWDNLGRTMAESFHIGALIADRARFTVGEDTHAAIAAAREKGAVFVSLHQGNWELAAPLLQAHGLPVAGVYQQLQNPFTEASASAFRSPHYALGLHSKGHDTARTLLRIVGDHGTVTIMADLRDLTGVSVPFFGLPAPSTGFPALLARGRNVPLFAGVVFREKGARFTIRTTQIPIARTDDRDADILATTAAIQSCFEGYIREHPGQWMWGHRRWSR